MGTADKLIKALDGYFESAVSAVLAEKIKERTPGGFVYSFASPYASDRKYYAHGAYYADGDLVEQVPDEDGILVTKFTCGFDVIWYKPGGFPTSRTPSTRRSRTAASCASSRRSTPSTISYRTSSSATLSTRAG